MQFRTIALLFLTLIFANSAARSDVPPEPGFKRVSLKLIVEPQDDFPEYRFFIKSGADLKEIVVKKAERITIEPLGGGAWYRSGTFLAVPKASLVGLGETVSDGNKLSELQKAVYDGKAAGIVELITHSFAREVRNAEASRLKDPIYRIEKDAEKGIKAELLSGGTNETQSNHNSGDFSIYSNEVKTPLFWATVIGGALMTLAFISLGVWYIRRSKMKPV